MLNVHKTKAVDGNARMSFVMLLPNGEKVESICEDATGLRFIAGEDAISFELKGNTTEGETVNVSVSFDKVGLAVALKNWLMFEAGLPYDRKGGPDEERG